MRKSLKKREGSPSQKPKKKLPRVKTPSKSADFRTPVLASKTSKQELLETAVFDKRFASSSKKMIEHWKAHFDPRIRLVLLDWMSTVSAEKGLFRETFGLAVCYMDMRVAADPKMEKRHLQLSALACISLASKVEQNKVAICYRDQISTVFSYNQVSKEEGLIMKDLEWRLSPDTHVHWLSLLMFHWDSYISKTKNKYENVRYTTQNKQAFQRNREVYQIGNFMYFHIKSLQYEKQPLCLNIFYTITKKNCLQLERSQNYEDTATKILKKDHFFKFYVEFIKVICEINFKTDLALIRLVCRMFEIQINYGAPHIAIQNPEESDDSERNKISKYSHVYNVIHTHNVSARNEMLEYFNGN